MKTLLIVSDTHGNIEGVKNLSKIMGECDYVFHLGDFCTDLRGLDSEIYDKLYFVKGNCDGGGDDLFLEIEDVKIMLTHGDRYGVKSSLTKLYLKAKERGVSVVFYGHTHTPIEEEYDGVKFINPGTLSIYGNKTYCYAVINKDKITTKIVYI